MQSRGGSENAIADPQTVEGMMVLPILLLSPFMAAIAAANRWQKTKRVHVSVLCPASYKFSMRSQCSRRWSARFSTLIDARIRNNIDRDRFSQPKEAGVIGRRIWAIAEGYIPGRSFSEARDLISHEAVCILNANDLMASIELTLYFENREPAGPYRLSVGPGRTRHFRLTTSPTLNLFRAIRPIRRSSGPTSLLLCSTRETDSRDLTLRSSAPRLFRRTHEG